MYFNSTFLRLHFLILCNKWLWQQEPSTHSHTQQTDQTINSKESSVMSQTTEAITDQMFHFKGATLTEFEKEIEIDDTAKSLTEKMKDYRLKSTN